LRNLQVKPAGLHATGHSGFSSPLILQSWLYALAQCGYHPPQIIPINGGFSWRLWISSRNSL
jgi:hypothetical protein